MLQQSAEPLVVNGPLLRCGRLYLNGIHQSKQHGRRNITRQITKHFDENLPDPLLLQPRLNVQLRLQQTGPEAGQEGLQPGLRPVFLPQALGDDRMHGIAAVVLFQQAPADQHGKIGG